MCKLITRHNKRFRRIRVALTTEFTFNGTYQKIMAKLVKVGVIFFLRMQALHNFRAIVKDSEGIVCRPQSEEGCVRKLRRPFNAVYFMSELSSSTPDIDMYSMKGIKL